METFGIIYKITNKINNKSYIGKTKSHYGETPFGSTGRLKHHLTNAFTPSKQNDCPLFYNAIRKYGKEAFILEVLVECNLINIDQFEISLIKLYLTTDRKFGYNIASGGKGRSVVDIPDEIRLKISQAQKSGVMNISEIIMDSKVIGYKVRRRENGIIFQQDFGSKKNTPEKNLEMAQKYLESIKYGNIIEKPYHKNNDLPQCIVESGNGYRVSIMINKKIHTKSFTNSTISRDKKLEYAKKWMQCIRENTDQISEYDVEIKRPVNLQNITITKNKDGDITGYCVKIIRNKKIMKKSFQILSLSMEDKHKLAIKWRDMILQTLRKNEQEDSSKEDRDNPQPSLL